MKLRERFQVFHLRNQRDFEWNSQEIDARRIPLYSSIYITAHADMFAWEPSIVHNDTCNNNPAIYCTVDRQKNHGSQTSRCCQMKPIGQELRPSISQIADLTGTSLTKPGPTFQGWNEWIKVLLASCLIPGAHPVVCIAIVIEIRYASE